MLADPGELASKEIESWIPEPALDASSTQRRGAAQKEDDEESEGDYEENDNDAGNNTLIEESFVQNPGYRLLSLDGFYYSVHHKKRTWMNAMKICKKEGGSLAIIYHELTRSIVSHYLGNDNGWIDATDKWTEGYWETSLRRPAPFLPWATGEPSNKSGENCAELNGEKMVNDVPCSWKRKFICQKAGRRYHRQHCFQHKIRLNIRGVFAKNYGRVEVNHNGRWGTVCDDVFDRNNRAATVVCRMLGYRWGVPRPRARYGRGTGKIWLDNVKCIGNEESIFSCRRNRIGRHNCGHWEDVGVYCY